MWLQMPVEESDGTGRQTAEQSGPAPKTRHAARGADLPAVKQPLHAALRAGVEKPRLRSSGYGRASSTMPTTSSSSVGKAESKPTRR